MALNTFINFIRLLNLAEWWVGGFCPSVAPFLFHGRPLPRLFCRGQGQDCSGDQSHQLQLYICVLLFSYRYLHWLCIYFDLAALGHLMFSTEQLQSLSIPQIFGLIVQLIQEIQRREEPPPDPPVFDRPGPRRTVHVVFSDQLRDPLCGYRCQFCTCPCTRGSAAHTHHKCYEHRHWR